jgi:hypothetical protein
MQKVELNIIYSSVINTLPSCLNENEIFSLIPYKINRPPSSPLFKYEKFIRKINHQICVDNIINYHQVIKFYYLMRKIFGILVIYHMIMRQGSNLEKFVIRITKYCDFQFLHLINMELQI